MVGHQLLHERVESRQRFERARRQPPRGQFVLQRFPQGEFLRAGCRLDRAQRGTADPSRRGVDDALERRYIARIARQPRVSQHVADFRARVKTEPAHQAISDAVAAQGFFQHTRLGVGAVQDGHAAVSILGESFRNLARHIQRFLVGIPRFIETDAVAARSGPSTGSFPCAPDCG